MYKTIVFAIGVCMISLSLYGQNSDIGEILSQIEENNKKLQAYSSLIESRHLDLKTQNNLPDPQTDVYYLPWGDNPGGSYMEFQISQSFEFPTVYGTRGKLISKRKEKMETDYRALRQKVLLEAKMHLLEIIHLNKKLAVEKERTRQARQVFDHIRELYEEEEVGKLDLNKAKISWMQEQFKVQQIQNQKRNELVLLKELNGGNEVVFSQSEYDHALAMESFDSLWKDKKKIDPKLATLEQQEKVARQQVKLSKIQALPDLAAGYNYQGAPSSSFSGLYAGISIPLWNSRNELKAAKARVLYQESYTQTQTMQSYARFQKRYNEYQMLLDKLKTYQSTLQDLNSEKLLLESYRLGEISFIEYYMELQFYQRAYDSMLRVENRLNKLKAEILKHQL